MAVKLLSLMMAAQAFFSSGAAAVTKMQTRYASGEMGAVLSALESRGVVYKRTIMMAVVQPSEPAGDGDA